MIGYNIDLASILLYVFWAFFAGLIWYLHRENKREGYPLIGDDPRQKIAIVGFPAPPPSKTYLLPHGAPMLVANGRPDTRAIAAKPVAPWPGAPLEPTGDPMADGVGPASYAERADHPDMTWEGAPKIVPLRVAGDFYLAKEDPDPRGMVVKGADGKAAGVVKDVWVDRSEYIARYFEVELEGGGRTVLLPWNFARIHGGARVVSVQAVHAKHFANVPALRNPEQITLLEEDKICGYYGGGVLYAHPSRLGPIL